MKLGNKKPKTNDGYGTRAVQLAESAAIRCFKHVSALRVGSGGGLNVQAAI